MTSHNRPTETKPFVVAQALQSQERNVIAHDRAHALQRLLPAQRMHQCPEASPVLLGYEEGGEDDCRERHRHQHFPPWIMCSTFRLPGLSEMVDKRR
jgi:hypothetical protein